MPTGPDFSGVRIWQMDSQFYTSRQRKFSGAVRFCSWSFYFWAIFLIGVTVSDFKVWTVDSLPFNTLILMAHSELAAEYSNLQPTSELRYMKCCFHVLLWSFDVICTMLFGAKSLCLFHVRCIHHGLLCMFQLRSLCCHDGRILIITMCKIMSCW